MIYIRDVIEAHCYGTVLFTLAPFQSMLWCDS